MRITNELNLPEPLVAAIRNDGYVKGDCDYSVTGLIRPVRIAALSRKYDEHLVEDVSERIYSLFGRAVHTILEYAASDTYWVEKRYFFPFADKIISGQIDVYDRETKMLSDYKFCSRYVVSDGVKPEWTAQNSMNALLMRRNGIEVKSAEIVAIFRDWSKMMAARKSDYPQRDIERIPVPLWSEEKTEAYILERIAAHEAGKDNPPVCTPEERWEKPNRWALMKKGRKRAIKLFESEAEAIAAQDGPSETFIEPRPGENVRCLHFCPVTAYCDFGREQLLAAAGE